MGTRNGGDKDVKDVYASWDTSNEILRKKFIGEHIS